MADKLDHNEALLVAAWRKIYELDPKMAKRLLEKACALASATELSQRTYDDVLRLVSLR